MLFNDSDEHQIESELKEQYSAFVLLSADIGQT